jgi:Tfp pilus assembly protein PilF
MRSGRKEPRSRALAGILVLAAGLAGCQTSTRPESEPFLPEVGALSSSELNDRGRQDLAAGNSGNAERYFREAIERNDQDVTSWIGIAAAYDNLRRFDLADRAYAQAIRLGGETLTIVNNRGYSYLLVATLGARSTSSGAHWSLTPETRSWPTISLC